MKAMRIHKFGGSDVLQLDEIQQPLAQAGELLVRVAAASVNPVDFKMRAGGYKAQEQGLPITLGRDLAGTVEQVGSEVTGFAIGDDIFALLGRDRGAYAKYVIVKPGEAAHSPESLNFVDAAAVPLAGLTAWQGLFDHGWLEAGQRVLIHGGAGGVGHFAVQFAKARGAFVAATGAAEDADYLRSIGADEVIDYKTHRFEDEVSDIDLVYDLIGGETQKRSWNVLKLGGTIVSTLGEPQQDEAQRHGVRGIGYMTEPNAAELAEIAGLIEVGKVKPSIQATFTLEQTGSAQDALEHGHVRGKIVLTL